MSGLQRFLTGDADQVLALLDEWKQAAGTLCRGRPCYEAAGSRRYLMFYTVLSESDGGPIARILFLRSAAMRPLSVREAQRLQANL